MIVRWRWRRAQPQRTAARVRSARAHGENHVYRPVAADGRPVALADLIDFDASHGDVVHVVGGDRLSAAIAAASVVAKVTRDRLMERMAVCHPGYGFERHAGYGTRDHERAIARLGLCDQHRRSIKKLAGLAAAGESD